MGLFILLFTVFVSAMGLCAEDPAPPNIHSVYQWRTDGNFDPSDTGFARKGVNGALAKVLVDGLNPDLGIANFTDLMQRILNRSLSLGQLAKVDTSRFDETIRKLSEDLKNATQNLNDANAQNKRLTNELEAARSEQQRLTQELDQLTAQKKSLSEQLSAAEAKAKGSQLGAEKLEAAKAENKRLTVALAAAQSKEHKLTQELNQLKAHQKRLVEELNSARDQNKSLRAQLKEAQDAWISAQQLSQTLSDQLKQTQSLVPTIEAAMPPPPPVARSETRDSYTQTDAPPLLENAETTTQMVGELMEAGVQNVSDTTVAGTQTNVFTEDKKVGDPVTTFDATVQASSEPKDAKISMDPIVMKHAATDPVALIGSSVATETHPLPALVDAESQTDAAQEATSLPETRSVNGIDATTIMDPLSEPSSPTQPQPVQTSGQETQTDSVELVAPAGAPVAAVSDTVAPPVLAPETVNAETMTEPRTGVYVRKDVADLLAGKDEDPNITIPDILKLTGGKSILGILRQWSNYVGTDENGDPWTFEDLLKILIKTLGLKHDETEQSLKALLDQTDSVFGMSVFNFIAQAREATGLDEGMGAGLDSLARQMHLDKPLNESIPLVREQYGITSTKGLTLFNASEAVSKALGVKITTEDGQVVLAPFMDALRVILGLIIEGDPQKTFDRGGSVYSRLLTAKEHIGTEPLDVLIELMNGYVGVLETQSLLERLQMLKESYGDELMHLTQLNAFLGEKATIVGDMKEIERYLEKNQTVLAAFEEMSGQVGGEPGVALTVILSQALGRMQAAVLLEYVARVEKSFGTASLERLEQFRANLGEDPVALVKEVKDQMEFFRKSGEGSTFREFLAGWRTFVGQDVTAAKTTLQRLLGLGERENVITVFESIKPAIGTGSVLDLMRQIIRQTGATAEHPVTEQLQLKGFSTSTTASPARKGNEAKEALSVSSLGAADEDLSPEERRSQDWARIYDSLQPADQVVLSAVDEERQALWNVLLASRGRHMNVSTLKEEMKRLFGVEEGVVNQLEDLVDKQFSGISVIEAMKKILAVSGVTRDLLKVLLTYNNVLGAGTFANAVGLTTALFETKPDELFQADTTSLLSLSEKELVTRPDGTENNLYNMVAKLKELGGEQLARSFLMVFNEFAPVRMPMAWPAFLTAMRGDTSILLPQVQGRIETAMGGKGSLLDRSETTRERTGRDNVHKNLSSVDSMLTGAQESPDNRTIQEKMENNLSALQGVLSSLGVSGSEMPNNMPDTIKLIKVKITKQKREKVADV